MDKRSDYQQFLDGETRVGVGVSGKLYHPECKPKAAEGTVTP